MLRAVLDFFSHPGWIGGVLFFGGVILDIIGHCWWLRYGYDKRQERRICLVPRLTLAVGMALLIRFM